MGTPKKAVAQKRFLEAFASFGTVSGAAQVAGIDRRTHYKWLSVDATYGERFRDAEATATDRLESEAVRRALIGIEEPVFGNARGDDGKSLGTQQVGTVKKYSDTLLIFLLKARRPQVFREKYEHTVTGTLTVEEVSRARQTLRTKIEQMAEAVTSGNTNRSIELQE